jgi:hypothetical protein
MPTPAFGEAFEKVGKLSATFQANEARYLYPDYQEAEARNDFIDKFFIALGWDVNHDVQTNPYEQEVKVEPPVSAGGQRRADYAFRLAPNYRDVRFFVEAKKPHGDIATADNYFQTIRYGWNSDTPLAVLTDFRQFHVLDCRYKPNIDTALSRYVAKYHYTEYLDPKRFAEIYWLFSREAVAGGSLEKRAKELPKPRGKAVPPGLFPSGYQRIDESFLKELDEYRTALARTFKNKNSNLDSETLTELAQRVLDRLVFLRFLEDKGIEPQRIVDRFGDRGTAWEDFIAASRRLDGIYNGIVFKHHDMLDGDRLSVDETIFADICDSLAHVNSPYDFNAIPIHILGSIYERFLSNVIVATDKRVRVEPKPEVRKAGGVYYTPEYVVRYIVDNTVGKLIAGKTPAQIADMRFADIACGSGSFLLSVFDQLLTYHGNYYNKSPNKARKGDCIEHDGKLYLSLSKKREILLNNIYGVDIDAQAVEVCELSLYLKLLQEETEASTHQYMLDFAHIAQMKKLLPDLSKNIVCGNSLIGRDIACDLYGEERKLNPMDFIDAFPEVMKRGGFDAIVGNPPYIPIESMLEAERTYFQTYYRELERKFDTSVVFILRALSMLRGSGLLGYISSITWQTGENYSMLREALFKKAGIRELINLPFDVFKDAYVDTGIYIIGKELTKSYRICRFPKKAKIESLHQIPLVKVDSALVQPPQYKVVLDPHVQKLLTRCADQNRFTTLGAITKSTQGLAANRFERSGRLPRGDWYPFAEAGQAHRYRVKIDSTSAANMLDFPALKQFYEAEPKILIRRVINRQDRLDAAYFERQMVFKKDLNPFIPTDSTFNPLFLLGLLNSRLLSYLYINTSTIATKDDFRQTTLAELRRLPVVIIKFSDQDKIVVKVKAMLEAKELLAKAKTDKDKTYYENKCTALDLQIDRLVYELYGLTAEEIAVVEGASAKPA